MSFQWVDWDGTWNWISWYSLFGGRKSIRLWSVPLLKIFLILFFHRLQYFNYITLRMLLVLSPFFPFSFAFSLSSSTFFFSQTLCGKLSYVSAYRDWNQSLPGPCWAPHSPPVWVPALPTSLISELNVSSDPFPGGRIIPLVPTALIAWGTVFSMFALCLG